eukprot:6172405-Pleurochrysis_carterae.AAC.6
MATTRTRTIERNSTMKNPYVSHPGGKYFGLRACSPVGQYPSNTSAIADRRGRSHLRENLRGQPGACTCTARVLVGRPALQTTRAVVCLLTRVAVSAHDAGNGACSIRAAARTPDLSSAMQACEDGKAHA